MFCLFSVIWRSRYAQHVVIRKDSFKVAAPAVVSVVASVLLVEQLPNT